MRTLSDIFREELIVQVKKLTMQRDSAVSIRDKDIETKNLVTETKVMAIGIMKDANKDETTAYGTKQNKTNGMPASYFSRAAPPLYRHNI